MSIGPLTLGTAGHIDHGKTELVKALTGVDTDRLPEERARGISIALGFAPLRLPSGRRVSLVDVPGHERFVRTMVAGATGIDLFLMVIAADDGVMPQTLEHAAVLAGLGVEEGVVAVTKCDLADPAPAATAARELFPASEVVSCSARTGVGLDELRAALDSLAERLPSRADAPGPAILHIDRAFSVRGQGTVVTGTLWSGALERGESLVLLGARRRVRVRGLEVHGEQLERAYAGQRVAVNLSGVRRREVERGDVLGAAGALSETRTLDCALDLRDASHNARVHVHHGTREAAGRIVWLGDDLWQLRLERPLCAARGDRLVIRQPSPPDTLGGGVVLDPDARRHGRREEILERLRSRRDGRPEPPSPTPSPEAVTPPAAPDLAALAALTERLRESGRRPLSPTQLGADRALLRALRASGVAVRVSGELYAHASAVEEVRRSVTTLLEHEPAISLAQVRDELGISRKAAQAFLEHLDMLRVTKRLPDDRRVLARRTRSES
jgi:selenocysteine-specific elongation factor